MPVTVELKYEYFLTWPGKVKLIEVILGILCLACCGPAYFSTQHWFLLVVVLGFLGSLFYSLYYLCLDVYLKPFSVNWLQTEFWFTTVATFLYFTAFVAELADFAEMEPDSDFSQTWIDAQVAAGIFALFNNVAYGVGAYFLYLDWKSNPVDSGVHMAPPI